MDITIQREALLKPLQAVSGIVEKKQTLPILSNVLLTVKDQQLLLTATDFEIELIAIAQLESGAAPESITVSARKLFDICRALPENASLRLSLEKNHLVVRTGESRFALNTLPAKDFPALEEGSYSSQLTLKQHQLKNLLARTYFAMGQQDVRHYLNGALLDISANTLKCIAADGHRLALTELHDVQTGKTEARIILPRKSVLELIRLLNSDDDANVTMGIGENRIRIVLPEIIFTSKLINAQYPDYHRLIPKGNQVILGDRETIKQAFVRAAILSNEKFRGVRLQLENNKLLISANNADQEQAEDSVALEYDGDKVEIGFNVGYLLDAVSVMTTEQVRFALTGASEGVLIEPVEQAQSAYRSRYVVMPMRL